MSTIQGTNVAATIVPFDSADTYPTHDAAYGRGGYRAVNTVAERDAIPAARKSPGMRVRVLADVDSENNVDWEWSGSAWVLTAYASSAADAAAAEASRTAAEAALAEVLAVVAADPRSIWPTTAAALGQGVQGTSALVGGSGGTNGTFPLTFSGGTQVIAPAGRFVVSGGAVVSVIIDYPGYYSSGTPTIGLTGSSGLTGASVSAAMGANTPEGDYFAVPSAVAGEALIIYRVTSGPAATEVTRTSNASALQTLDRVVPFIVVPPAGSSLLRIHDITLNDDVDLSGIDQMYVRYAFRDNVGFERFVFILSSWDGSAYVDRIGVAASGGNIDPTGFAGQVVLELKAVSGSALPGKANGEVVGRMRFDFGAEEDFAGSFAYADSALYVDKLKVPAGVRQVAEDLAHRNVEGNALNRLLPYINTPRIGSTLLRLVGDPVLNDDIDLSAYPLITVRNVFRDNPGSPRFNFLMSAFDGTSTYTPIIGVGPSTASIDPTGFTGQREIELKAVSGSAFPGYANGDTVGYMRIDFGEGEDFGPTFNYDHSEGGLYVERLQVSPGVRKAIEVVAANKMALSSGLKLPFVDELANDYLRSIFKEIALYQVDKSHTYVIGGVEFNEFPGIPLTRVILTIRDITDGVDVCRFSAQTGDGSTLAEFLATLPTTVKFQQDSLTDYTGVYAVVKVDWGKAVATSTTYTTAAQAGINPRCLFGDDDLGDYLDRDHAHEVIEVGAGKAFTTLRAAVESLYISSTDHQCHRAHYGHRIRIRLVDDGTFNATLLDIPEFVEVWGNGRGRTIIKRENTNTDAMLEAHLDSKFRHFTIYSESSEYAFHHDDFNRKSISTAGKHVRTIRQSLKDVDLIGGPSNNVWLYGCGLSSGEELLFENVYAAHEKVDATEAAFGFHNSGPTLSVPSLGASKRPATVRFIGCQTPDPSGSGLYVQTLEDGPTNIVSLINSQMGVVFETVASSGEVLPDLARNRFGYAIGGVYEGPLRRVDPEGATVLATTAGAAVSGTAAALIFGTVDELGRGEKWILNGTSRSLGARLGDCSSVNKTLTIGGVTCTFSTNLTAASNSTIIAAINAAIPLNPVAEVDIQKELYPDAAPSMRLLNGTGSTLARGLFVSRSGATTAVPANAAFVATGATFAATAGQSVFTLAVADVVSLATLKGLAPSGVATLSFSYAGGALSFHESCRVVSYVVSGGISTFTFARPVAWDSNYSDSGLSATISPAVTSRVFGFVPRPILNGLSGRIVISRQIHSDYIPGASTDGEFGVVAGALDYAATPKVGRVEAGIVILYP